MYNKRLTMKINEARLLVEQLKQTGVNAILDEKTGEIEIPGAEFDKLKVWDKLSDK